MSLGLRGSRGSNLFKKQFVGFQWMVWPPHSLRMSPIKHLWDMVERSIDTKDPAPTNIRKLKTAIHRFLYRCWAMLNISLEVFLWLVESIAFEIVALCLIRGGSTQYKEPISWPYYINICPERFSNISNH